MSLRGRIIVSLLVVFLLGMLTAGAFYSMELTELRQEWRALPVLPSVVENQIQHTVDEDVEFLLVLLLPLGVLAIAAVAITTHVSLRGIARIANQARRIGVESDTARLDTERLPKEIRYLVETINGTLDRLAAANALQRQFTQDAAHQLRTPLTVLQLRLQKARREHTTDWPVIDQDLAQMTRIVGQLLDLARKDLSALQRSEWKTVNLARILREAAAQILPLAESLSRPIEVSAPDFVRLHGHEADLHDMVRNLLENALCHGSGRIHGRLYESRSGDSAHALLEISDEGPGVPDNLKEAVFERFRKVAPHSPGPGLGLAIARQIVGMHGGEIHFLLGDTCRLRAVFPALSD